VKRAVVACVLAWAALWPLAHYRLVHHYGLNPWKFGAWAMYTVPTPPVLVALFTRSGGGYRHIDHQSLSSELQQVHRRFQMDRHVWGDLARPDDLARAALAELPGVHSIVIIVQRMTLDPETSRMVSAKAEYDYDRRTILASR